MKKFLNRPMYEIMNFSKEENEEYSDLLPKDFHNSMAFFMSLEIKKNGMGDDVICFIDSASFTLNYMFIPQIGYRILNKHFILKIFKSAYLNLQEMAFIERVLCFLFHIPDGSVKVSLSKDPKLIIVERVNQK